MYKTNQIGPWPIVDAAASLGSDAGAYDIQGIADPLSYHLPAGGVGGSAEAYGSMGCSGTSAIANFGDHASFGVALAPLEDYGNGEPIIVDVSIALIASNGPGAFMIPTCGFSDDALTPAAGWSAQNEVTAWHVIGDSSMVFQTEDHGLFYNGHIVLKDIISGGLETERPFIIGATMLSINSNTGNFGRAYYWISARYSTSALNTYGRSL